MMTRKFSFFLAIFLLMSQLLSAPVSIHATESNGVTLVDESNVYQQTKYYKDSLFGVAGGFHLVGLNSVKNNVHINGNILTDKLIYGSDFGTSGVAEATYIRKIETGTAITVGGHEESILVLGKEVEVGIVDNGNAWSVNGNKVNRPSKNNNPNHLWQDGEREFIDLSQVEQYVVQLVSKLAKLENNSIEINNHDHNKQEIIVSSDNDFNVYNLKKGDFSFSTPIHLKGFEKNKASTLIINVDMSQMDNKNEFIIPNSIAHYTDGSFVSTGHVTNWSKANVVWNIYDSSNTSNLYTGTIRNSGAVTGSILAPKATVTLGHNLNGTVIAKDIIINGETHRDDYVNPEKIPEPKMIDVTVEKVWVGEAQDSVTINLLANGEVIDSAELSDLNGWAHIFTNLLVENEDGLIEYTVEEVDFGDSYESEVTGDAENGYVVTNTEIIIEPETTEVSVEKVWVGEAQDSVTIHLLANGNLINTVVLSDTNDWTHTFTNLPVENEQGLIEYSVEEIDADGYETTITGDAESGFIVTNKKIKEPEPEEPIEDETEKEPKDDQKTDLVKKETNKTSKEVSKLLPATATNVFNIFSIGFVLLIVGGLGYYLLRKKRTE